MQAEHVPEQLSPALNLSGLSSTSKLQTFVVTTNTVNTELIKESDM